MKKELFLHGMATGALAALFMVLNIVADIAFHSLETALLSFLVVALASTFSVKKISQTIGCCEPSLKQLIPVGILTTIIPVTTALFGAPNMGIKVVASITVLGAIGGAFWSTPFVLWDHFRNRGSDSD